MFIGIIWLLLYTISYDGSSLHSRIAISKIINTLQKHINTIPEQNTKEITAVAVSLYVIKAHVYFHKTFASNFSAYTTSTLKILSKTH